MKHTVLIAYLVAQGYTDKKAIELIEFYEKNDKLQDLIDYVLAREEIKTNG